MAWRLCFVVLIAAVFWVSTGAAGDPELAGEVFGAVPSEIESAAHYLFYLHGRIIEDEGVRPTHPEFGVYEYEEILRILAERGLVVISEVRPPAANGAEYAAKLADQVRELIRSGVPPEHITIVGFSKGGGIAILASSLLANDRLNFVFMGSCGPGYDSLTSIVPRGRLLGLSDVGDDFAGSCEALFARSPTDTEKNEIVTNLGGGHGAYYRPVSGWIDPVVTWAVFKP